MCDGMILTPSASNPQPGVAAIPIPNSVAKAGLLAVDLTYLPYFTPFLDEVRVLGGIPILPVELYLRKIQLVLNAYTGQNFGIDQLKAVLEEGYDEFTEVRRP